MYKIFLLLFIFLHLGICKGQNLVPNGSFEDTVKCPDGFSHLNYSMGWFQPTKGTPDFLHICNPFTHDAGTPQNFMGYQNPRTGVAYAGIFNCFLYPPDTTASFDFRDYREYCEIQLLSPLTAGTDYYVSYYVSLADSMNYATDEFAAYLSIDSLLKNSFIAIDSITPQIQNTNGNFITDKTTWTNVSGKFTAMGGEKFLTIGNFKNHAATDTIPVSGGSQNLGQSDWWGGYYYVDDVCVSTDSLTCNSSVGINEFSKRELISVFPNPCQTEVQISIDIKEPVFLRIYDIIGKVVVFKSFIHSTSIMTSQLRKGIYIYELSNSNGIIKTGKLIKD